MGRFTGFKPDGFKFFMELSFNNNKQFYTENKQRYIEGVKEPMEALVSELLPTVQRIDPSVNSKVASHISRIYRDTRFSRDKTPYRNNIWAAFRGGDGPLSSYFVMFAEINISDYMYGIGMYAPLPGLMQELRLRIMARPSEFLRLANGLWELGYTLDGEKFKRDRYPDAAPEIKDYLNYKSVSWIKKIGDHKKVLSPALLDELKEAYGQLEGMYRFIMREEEGK